MNCPECGQSDLVDKVSKIYMTAIERKYAARNKGKQQLTDSENGRLKIDSMMNSQELSGLTKKLSPPTSGKKSTFRPIHPDLVVLVFSLISPIFLYRIAINQQVMLPWILLLMAVFYGFYFWKRKYLTARFDAQLQAQKAAEERVQNGIKRWMQLYYCARDEIVFNPLDSQSVQVDLINGYLLQL